MIMVYAEPHTHNVVGARRMFSGLVNLIFHVAYLYLRAR